MKTKQECIDWLKMLMNMPQKPNVEDCNYLRSIIAYLEETKDE